MGTWRLTISSIKLSAADQRCVIALTYCSTPSAQKTSQLYYPLPIFAPAFTSLQSWPVPSRKIPHGLGQGTNECTLIRLPLSHPLTEAPIVCWHSEPVPCALSLLFPARRLQDLHVLAAHRRTVSATNPTLPHSFRMSFKVSSHVYHIHPSSLPVSSFYHACLPDIICLVNFFLACAV